MRDGWHKVAGFEVYVEDNIVWRGILGDGYDCRTGYVYRFCKPLSYWRKETMSVAAFRAGVKRGTVSLI